MTGGQVDRHKMTRLAGASCEAHPANSSGQKEYDGTQSEGSMWTAIVTEPALQFVTLPIEMLYGRAAEVVQI